MTQRVVPDSVQSYFDNASVAMSLASCEADHPLVLVNPAFCALTGYAVSEILGQNCRFLQGNAHGDEKNVVARDQIRAFLQSDRHDALRVQIINFRKDGQPFVNLLFLSKLRTLAGDAAFVFASQFDISRSQPQLLVDYDDKLGHAISGLRPLLADQGMVFAGTVASIAHTASTIAQAKMTLEELDSGEFG